MVWGEPNYSFVFVFKEIILSDSPGLSDLSEDLNGGHRTSTPNMSKKRMGSAPELNFIRKQIEGSYFYFSLWISKKISIEQKLNYFCKLQTWKECILKSRRWLTLAWTTSPKPSTTRVASLHQTIPILSRAIGEQSVLDPVQFSVLKDAKKSGKFN